MKTKAKLYSLSLTLIIFAASVFYVSCKHAHPLDKDFKGNPLGNCFDGVKNQNETSIDCGGVCTACASCNDGVQNSGETGIDCGGSTCTTCAPPSSPNSCSTLNNQSVINMGGTSNAALYGAYLNTSSPSHGVATIHIDLYTNSHNISSYDIDFAAQDFANMAVGTQRVYTTVGYNDASSMNAGQTFVMITQTGFSYAQYSSKSGQYIYIKKISASLTQVWFCGLYTEETTSPQNTYNFSVSAKF